MGYDQGSKLLLYEKVHLLENNRTLAASLRLKHQLEMTKLGLSVGWIELGLLAVPVTVSMPLGSDACSLSEASQTKPYPPLCVELGNKTDIPHSHVNPLYTIHHIMCNHELDCYIDGWPHDCAPLYTKHAVDWQHLHVMIDTANV